MAATSGQRDTRVTIQTLTEATATSGLPREEFDDLAEVWAHKRQRSGDERFSSQQTSARSTTEWTVPYRCDMDPDLVDVAKERRIVYRGRVYDIVAAELLSRGGDILLTTIAKVG